MFVIDNIAKLADSVITRIWPDKSDQDKFKFQLALKEAMLEAESIKGQLRVNEQEARSRNIWVSGWRPGIGWVCTACFAWHYLLVPLISYISVMAGHPIPPLPQFDTSVLMNVTMGMLGIGMFRTYEKVKGVFR